jgi:hypothetical protein
MHNFLFVFLLMIAVPLKAEEAKGTQKHPVLLDKQVSPWSDSWDDVKETILLMGRGSYLQFQQKNNLYYAAAGIPSIWYSFENDDRIKNRYGGTDIKNIVDHVGDAGVVFNFPLIHLGFYYYGKKNNEDHHVQFAKEYFSSMYLALAETGILSYIQVHERPVTRNVSFWETEFRGGSSWPSGHVIPYMTLFFKTMQFYGPAWSTLPLALTVFSSMQRIQDQKHWLSDIVTSFFLSAWASEGVRAAAGYSKNHPFYKAVFEHDLQIGLLKHPHKQALGPLFSWSF